MELLVPSEMHSVTWCKCQTKQYISDVRSETWHVRLELTSDFSLEEGEVILGFRRACAHKRVGALRGMMSSSTAERRLPCGQGQLISVV